MMNLFKLQLEIRHADWPYILQGFIAYFVLSILAYFVLPDGGYEYFLLVISLLFIIFTFVHFNNIRIEEQHHSRYKIQALNELIKLLPIRAPLPPMVGWAATPELALNVYKVIEEKKPDLIVELGSGVTSIVSAYSLEKFNPEGRIVSFDHDADFADQTRKELKYHQLEKYVDIFDAPLSSINVNGKQCKWYDIDFSLIKAPIDMLIIDGPPLKTQQYARYPALPSFYQKLSDDALVIFHDTRREMESKTVKNWVQEFPDLTHSFLRTEKGISIFRRDVKN
ncbi:MAG: class I SAM-dependent methyltransferase [Balneolaceae bacterium]|nr:class I SAM-dependent methyltransferase [Balneolaceae bacterium]